MMDWVSLVAAGVSAASGLAVAIFTWRLFVVGRDQHRAVMESNSISRDTARRQLRAYVGCVGAEAHGIDGSAALQITIKFRNAGQTPAHGLSAKGGCRMFQYPGPTTFNEVSDHIHAPSTLVPGGETLKTETAPITAVQKRDLFAGKYALYAYGQATYTDVFGEQHVTHYRMLLGGRQKLRTQRKGDEVVGLLAHTEEGNESN
ncbi:MAG TPA: hypothetical protein VGU01_03085 [Sphingomicrobium sp.]|nr:hypothetical protein [Sphingomicrobium sp.]